MNSNLLPCPFCGSTNLRHEFSGSQGYIECNECGTQGPCDERAADPICDQDAGCAAWNRRAADRVQRHPVPVSEWRTIDTAPKDGTEILASDYDAVEILSWRKGRFELGIPGEWISRDGQAFFPAWWQPLADHPALPLPGEVEE